MNIYENFIENTGAKRVELNTKTILERYRNQLNDIEKIIIHSYNQIKETETKLGANGYSIAFIKEYMEKDMEIINRNLEEMFNKKFASMEEDLGFLKERVLLSTGDKEISRNNVIKLQTVLPNLSIEDKEKIFESNKDKDPNILEILYLNIKESNPIVASKIMEYLDEFIGQKEINIVQNQLEQIKGLKSYLTYDYVKALDSAYQAESIYQTVPGGAVNRIIGSYRESIEKEIANLN